MNENSGGKTVSRFWTGGRRRRLAWSLIISLILSIGLVLTLDPDSASSIKRGDFPAFYAAGKILLHGDENRLYDYRLHLEIQNEYWKSLKGDFYAFSYPPYVALLYEPLALYPPETAKLAVILFGLTALAAVAALSERINPAWRSHRLELIALLLCWAPLLSALVAGQNTIYSLLLLLIVARFAPRHGWGAALIGGTALALLFFKPHYAVLPFILLVCARRFRLVAAAAAELLLLYLLTAIRFGFAWPAEWLEAVRRFAADDMLANQHLMVSLSGFLNALLTRFDTSAAFNSGLNICLALLSLTAAAVLCRHSYIYGTAAAERQAGLAEPNDHRSRIDRRAELSELILLSGPVIALFSPHTLYYDSSLALLPLLLGLGERGEAALQSGRTEPGDRAINILLAVWAASFLFVTLKEYFPAQPLTLILAAWTVYLLRAEILRLKVYSLKRNQAAAN